MHLEVLHCDCWQRICGVQQQHTVSLFSYLFRQIKLMQVAKGYSIILFWSEQKELSRKENTVKYTHIYICITFHIILWRTSMNRPRIHIPNFQWKLPDGKTGRDEPDSPHIFLMQQCIYCAFWWAGNIQSPRHTFICTSTTGCSRFGQNELVNFEALFYSADTKAAISGRVVLVGELSSCRLHP